MTSRIRTAVVGLGYFGRFHARHHAQNPDCELVAVCDADEETARRIAGEHGCDALTDHQALKGRVDAVSIAVPTTFHARVARDLMESGVHVLIEKPVTETVDEAKALIAIAEARNLVFQVGHIESFSAVFKALRERVKAPLYLEATRVGPWRGGRAADVSVVLDLMIHDLDLVMSLVDAPVERVEALGAPVVSRSEDMARARLTFANGAIADVTASRVAEGVDRRLRVFEDGVFHECDFGSHALTRKCVGADAENPIAIERIEIAREDSLGNEIAEFVACVRDGKAPAVDGGRGAEALRVAQLVMEDARARLGRTNALSRNPAA